MKALSGFIFGISLLASFAQPMLLDETFAPLIMREGGGVTALATQADGRPVVSGSFETVGGLCRKGLARLNSDGTADPSFRSPTVSNIHTIVIVAEQTLVAGSFQNLGGKVAVARLQPDGTVDPSFDARLNLGALVSAVAVQDDGKILIAGTFTNAGGVPRRSIARFQINGGLDTSFDTGVGADGFIQAMVIDQERRIVLGGSFTNFNGVRSPFITRLRPNGSVDPDFAVAGRPDSGVYGLKEDANGRLVIGGYFNKIGEITRQYVARLKEDGSVDDDFVPAAPSRPVTDIALQDSKVVIGGLFSSVGNTPRNALARLNEDGSLDSSFVPGDAGRYPLSLASLPDGELLVGNQELSSAIKNDTNILVRLRPSGARHSTFSASFGIAGKVFSVVVGPNRELTVAGNFLKVNGIRRKGLARIHHDGSLDVSFDPMRDYSYVTGLCLREDGTYYAVGSFQSNSFQSNALLRISATGTVVPVDLTDYRLYSSPRNVKEQRDGRILLAGGKYHDWTTTPLQRFWPDGSADTNFAPVFDPGAFAHVEALQIESDDKIVIAGGFRQINGVARTNVARLNSDGTLDLTFGPGGMPNPYVYSCLRLPDGSYLVGGECYEYGQSCGGIARLSSSGAFDSSFTGGGGFNGAVYTLALQPDGKILAGGDFTSYNGTSVKPRIIRLDSNGQPDPAFNLGDGADRKVNDIKVTPYGDLIIAGAFSEVDSRERLGLARYLRLPHVTIEPNGPDCRFVRVLAPDGSEVVIEHSPNLSEWLPVSTNTPVAGVVQYNECGNLDRAKFFRAALVE